MSQVAPNAVIRLEAARRLNEIRRLLQGGFSYEVESACRRLDTLDHPSIDEIKVRAFSEVARAALRRAYLGLALSWLERIVDLGEGSADVVLAIVEISIVQGDAARARYYLERLRGEHPTDTRVRRYASLAA